MPTIGSFRQDDLFGQEGVLETPTLKAKIKFVPLPDRSGKQPDYRILAGKREVGAAWSRTAKNGGEYLFLKLNRSEPASPGVLQSLPERERSRRPLVPLIRMAPVRAGASPASRRNPAHLHLSSLLAPLDRHDGAPPRIAFPAPQPGGQVDQLLVQAAAEAVERR